MNDRLEETRLDLETGRDTSHEQQWWLVEEIDRLREALRRIIHYDVETNHGPIDEWAESEAFAVVSEIAAGALYHWKKQGNRP